MRRGGRTAAQRRRRAKYSGGHRLLRRAQEEREEHVSAVRGLMRRSPAAFAIPRRASAPKKRLPLRFFVVATAIIGTFVQPGAGRAQQNPPVSPGRPALPAQQDPVVGNWRGTLTSPTGESAIIITIAKKGDAYVGSPTGLNASRETALKCASAN